MVLISHPIWRRSKILLLSFVIGLATLDVQAQSRTISGKVTAADDGSSLPGVTLIIKGTTTGTVTDIEGSFSLEVPSDDAIIVASFVGYQSMELTVGTRSVLDFGLEVDIEQLDEVVVIGYGSQKKSDLTGAVASVTGDALRGTVTASIDQALQGRVAGVQVTQNSGQPGGAVSIRIRGTTSLTNSSEPLYVIDGIQIGGDAGDISGFDWQGGAGGQQSNASNPLASINPSDIESMEVLKDGSATAIYGSRGANGVIIITTKRGKKGEAKVSYNGFYAVQEVARTYDMMDLPTYAEYNNEVAADIPSINANERFADPSLLGQGTDWQDAIYQVAPMQSHQISVTGGSEKTTYMVSGGYFAQEGIVIGSDFERFNTRLNLDSEVKDGIKVGASLSFSMKDEKVTLQDGGDGVISQALQMPPHIPVYDFDGDFAGPDGGSADVGSNPVGLAMLRNNTVENQRFMGNFYGDIRIIEGLNFRSEVAYDYSNTLNKAFIPTYEWGSLSNFPNQLGQRQQSNFFWLWKNYATYTKTFGVHNITGMLGHEAQKGTYEGFVTYKENLASNDVVSLSQGENSERLTDGWAGENSLQSMFARAIYNYDERYLFTGTIRRDGSSRFGENKRWGWFPSASIAWRISNESFLAQSDVISNMKLRLSWAKVGNENIPNYAFGSSLSTLNSGFGTANRNSRYSNPNVQWETTTSINVGYDLAMWQGRVNLTLDAYIKDTDDLLLEVSLPGTYGDIIAGPQSNVGQMQNKGIEASLNTINIDKGKFKWSTDMNISINRNEVVALTGAPLVQNIYWYTDFQTAIRTSSGLPVAQFYGYETDGLFTTAEEILEAPVQINDPNNDGTNLIHKRDGLWLGDVKFVDQNGDGVINTDDQVEIGDPNPDFTFGFNNTFTYGPFVLDIFMTGAYGGDVFNFSSYRNQSMSSVFNNQDVVIADRATTTLIDPAGASDDIDNVVMSNPDTEIPRFSQTNNNRNARMSDRWIEDGSYLRIQNIKLAYTLPSSLTQKARLSRVQVYANVQNVYTFTNYTGLDPAVGAFEQNPLFQSVDMGRYPTPRVYTFGLNLDF
ncbi:MAG: TonB-dependent receptor [Reichenbachiella sp.]